MKLFNKEPYKIIYLISVFLLIGIYFGCDKAEILVVTEIPNNQIFLQYSSTRPFGEHFPVFDSVKFLPDSALMIYYEKIEGIPTRGTDLTEVYTTKILHRIKKDSSLDYGKVVFGGVDVQMSLYSTNWYEYTYSSVAINNIGNKQENCWYNFFNIKNQITLSCSDSKKIQNFNATIPIKTPNSFSNLIPGQKIDLSKDLEIKFNTPLSKGSVLVFGWNSNYICLQIVEPADQLIISVKTLQKVSEILIKEKVQKCQIGFVEGYFIGVLKTVDRVSLNKYYLPIFQFTRCSLIVSIIS